MTCKEVTEKLSITEFVKLCSQIDEKRPATLLACGSVQGPGFYQVAGGKLVRRFDVVNVEREDKKVYVTCDVTGEAQLMRFEVTGEAQLMRFEVAA